MASRAAAGPVPPAAFQIAKRLPAGRHALLEVFPGLDQLPLAPRLEADREKRARLFGETQIELVDQDLWMYVAPREMPKVPRRRGWSPVISPERDCIVVGLGHLRESPEMIVYLDIYHELCHIVQRRDGANLWEPGVSYVERWTEVEAYRFVIEEAKRLGVADAFLREYLRVEWISEAEHAQLLAAVGVKAARKRAEKSAA